MSLSPQSLTAFINLLRVRGELVEIDAEVDPHLEIAEIHRRVISANGPALLFRRPKGASFPIVTNLFGTRARVEAAFGSRPLELVRDLAALPHELMPPSAGKLFAKRKLFFDLLKVGERAVSRAPVCEVVRREPRLSELPILTSWQEDGGPFITLPLVYTEHPQTGVGNLGMYRMQRFDDQTTGIHWQIGKGGGFHHHLAESLNRPLPVTVFLGGPPALILSAIAPLPENVPELLLASLVMGRRLGKTRSPLSPHALVADAEFALVGEVRPHERRLEGPFGDHYGYYSLAHDYPVFHCRHVVHRKNAIFPATVVGKPRQEDFYIGDFLQELLSPLFPIVMPAVSDLWSYGETGYHALSAAVVKERYAREALSSAFRILGEGQLSLTKFLLLVDKPQDLRDFKSVLEYVLARAQFERDLYVFGNVSMDTLDYTGPAVNHGSKGVLVGVGDPIRELPAVFQGELPAFVKDVAVFCRGALVIETRSFVDEPHLLDQIIAHPVFARWPLLVIVDDAKQAAKSAMNFLWTTFTRFEPAADIVARRELVRNSVSFHAPIAIDARMKPNYPKELFCDPETAKTVSARWKVYFPHDAVEMGDSDHAHLD